MAELTPEEQQAAYVEWRQKYAKLIQAGDDEAGRYPRTWGGRAEAKRLFPLAKSLQPSPDPWYEKVFEAITIGGIATGFAIGGGYALGFWGAAPGVVPATGEVALSTIVPEAPSAFAGSTATFDVAELAAYDAALAEGAAAGVGLVPAGLSASGAETVVSPGIFSSIGEGLKSVGSGIIGTIGILGTSLAKGAEKGITGLIDREVSSAFGGNGSPGVTTNVAGEQSPTMSMLPWILIGVTLLGAFILTRKRRK